MGFNIKTFNIFIIVLINSFLCTCNNEHIKLHDKLISNNNYIVVIAKEPFHFYYPIKELTQLLKKIRPKDSEVSHAPHERGSNTVIKYLDSLILTINDTVLYANKITLYQPNNRYIRKYTLNDYLKTDYSVFIHFLVKKDILIYNKEKDFFIKEVLVQENNSRNRNNFIYMTNDSTIIFEVEYSYKVYNEITTKYRRRNFFQKWLYEIKKHIPFFQF